MELLDGIWGQRWSITSAIDVTLKNTSRKNL
jgi:hypothetical protein